MKKNAGKSEEKLALIEHIKELEMQGRFHEDAQENPPHRSYAEGYKLSSKEHKE